ncbi:MAG: hypothetical protein ACLSB9_13890 [Hydrogeniiclostridium mannosilyticum]
MKTAISIRRPAMQAAAMVPQAVLRPAVLPDPAGSERKTGKCECQENRNIFMKFIRNFKNYHAKRENILTCS